MSFLDHLHWRYATKKFDQNRKVSDNDLEIIIEAIRMTPTSYGLQPYHFYIVQNQDIKNQIQKVSWDQPQVGTCSHLIVFAVRRDLIETKEEYLTLMSADNPEIREKLRGFEDMLEGFILGKSESELFSWASRQVYIALGFAMTACAELEIDSCPMEGSDFRAVDTILGLPETQKSLVMLPIGYRAEGETPRGNKVRFSREALFTEIG